MFTEKCSEVKASLRAILHLNRKKQVTEASGGWNGSSPLGGFNTSIVAAHVLMCSAVPIPTLCQTWSTKSMPNHKNRRLPHGDANHCQMLKDIEEAVMKEDDSTTKELCL